MRDSLSETFPAPVLASADAKAEALFSLGSFYMKQGFPRQGLALLLAAQTGGLRCLELDRAIAHGFLLCGSPKRALAQLDIIEPELNTQGMREAARYLRGRSLLALGRVDDAQTLFQKTTPAPTKRIGATRKSGRQT